MEWKEKVYKCNTWGKRQKLDTLKNVLRQSRLLPFCEGLVSGRPRGGDFLECVEILPISRGAPSLSYVWTLWFQARLRACTASSTLTVNLSTTCSRRTSPPCWWSCSRGSVSGLTLRPSQPGFLWACSLFLQWQHKHLYSTRDSQGSLTRDYPVLLSSVCVCSAAIHPILRSLVTNQQLSTEALGQISKRFVFGASYMETKGHGILVSSDDLCLITTYHCVYVSVLQLLLLRQFLMFESCRRLCVRLWGVPLQQEVWVLLPADLHPVLSRSGTVMAVLLDWHRGCSGSHHTWPTHSAYCDHSGFGHLSQAS